jgi:hypothetical protein
MKRFLSVLVLFTLLAVSVHAQATNTMLTSRFTEVKSGDYVVGYQYDATFTCDSINTLILTDNGSPISPNKWNPAQYPAIFRLKAANTTGGTPNEDIYLQALVGSTSDTVTVDTLRATSTNQRQTDTLGTVLNKWAFPRVGYQVFIRNKTNDIQTGYLTIFFPISPLYKQKGL